jgi:hypothetical protein
VFKEWNSGGLAGLARNWKDVAAAALGAGEFKRLQEQTRGTLGSLHCAIIRVRRSADKYAEHVVSVRGLRNLLLVGPLRGAC